MCVCAFPVGSSAVKWWPFGAVEVASPWQCDRAGLSLPVMDEHSQGEHLSFLSFFSPPNYFVSSFPPICFWLFRRWCVKMVIYLSFKYGHWFCFSDQHLYQDHPVTLTLFCVFICCHHAITSLSTPLKHCYKSNAMNWVYVFFSCRGEYEN